MILITLKSLICIYVCYSFHLNTIFLHVIKSAKLSYKLKLFTQYLTHISQHTHKINTKLRISLPFLKRKLVSFRNKSTHKPDFRYQRRIGTYRHNLAPTTITIYYSWAIYYSQSSGRASSWREYTRPPERSLCFVLYSN